MKIITKDNETTLVSRELTEGCHLGEFCRKRSCDSRIVFQVQGNQVSEAPQIGGQGTFSISPLQFKCNKVGSHTQF